MRVGAILPTALSLATFECFVFCTALPNHVTRICAAICRDYIKVAELM